MQTTIIENTGALSLKFDANNNPTPTSINTILETSSIHLPYQSLESNHFVAYSFQIESFDLAVHLPSKAIAPIPPISPEDTTAERASKIREIESRFPKIGLELYLDHGGGWVRRALVPLQNRGAEWYISLLYPFLGSNEVLLLGTNSKVGAKVIPLETNGAFHGGLEFNDYLIISGTWKQTISLIPKLIETLEITRNIGVDVGSEGITPIAPYRPSRGLIWLQNSGLSRIYLTFHSDPSQLQIGSGIYLDPGATAAYESLKYNLPQPLYAKAVSGASRLEGMEAY
ncbi:hypothetical protein [Laspinema olomoucense]|uniref:hypothetical protein n=1 Tax=Laspinema olomoucense TaxID=3231600 RepID=UPI0021BB9FE9|nr:hypothetical protein [Laspinema sp. D3d]MCT7971093.1 hypothetical protein [Laspinema sp. D3d]